VGYRQVNDSQWERGYRKQLAHYSIYVDVLSHSRNSLAHGVRIASDWQNFNTPSFDLRAGGGFDGMHEIEFKAQTRTEALCLTCDIQLPCQGEFCDPLS